MLQLNDIRKVYGEGENAVEALKGVDLAFRKSEFVSILGPSGCGKTTMLNILGGLDRYTSGDLMIDGKSTQLFKAFEWDAYRNNCVGFIFQNYNLITHQSILENVELALALSGVSTQERRRRATAALAEVGLGNMLGKKPNQMSGGQMQRVAIARAIVNNPEIILADEPTGALDSVNSVQIIELLQEVAKNRLVVMVTHNDDIAAKYSTRIIKMLDGEIVDDSDHYVPTEEDLVSTDMIYTEEAAPIVDGLDENTAKKILAKHKKQQIKKQKAVLNKTSMSIGTSFRLSVKNLFTKKGRTFMTAFAGSIGIIGIALVMSISNGFNIYMEDMQKNMLGQYPISIMQEHMNMEGIMSPPQFVAGEKDRFPDNDIITVPESEDSNMNDMISQVFHYNKITQEYMDYISEMPEELYAEISYKYAMNPNLITKKSDGSFNAVEFKTDPITAMMYGTPNLFNELASDAFMTEQYEVLEGNYPTSKNEIVLLVNEFNEISEALYEGFGYDTKENFTFKDVIGQEFSMIGNDSWYGDRVGNQYERNINFNQDMFDNGTNLKIVGVMRIKKDASVKLYQEGVLYHPDLTPFALNDSINSKIGKAQAEEKVWDLATGKKIKDIELEGAIVVPGSLLGMTDADRHHITMQRLGASTVAKDIIIYPNSFEGKDELKEYLDEFNLLSNQPEKKHILYNDPSTIMTDMMGQIVSIISIVLVAFASVSLFVSSIMIGIITYVSVVERTKEIGILRSIGARKVDIGRVFNAETTMIGFAAGAIGIIISYLLTIPINIIIKAVSNGAVITNLSVLNPLVALVLVVISVVLTFLAGIIPSSIAAKKDPVKALRSE